MNLSDLIEKLGKTIFEAPFDAALAPKDFPELAEIRLAVLDEILKKGQRVGGKRRAQQGTRRPVAGRLGRRRLGQRIRQQAGQGGDPADERERAEGRPTEQSRRAHLVGRIG